MSHFCRFRCRPDTRCTGPVVSAPDLALGGTGPAVLASVSKPNRRSGRHCAPPQLPGRQNQAIFTVGTSKTGAATNKFIALLVVLLLVVRYSIKSAELIVTSYYVKVKVPTKCPQKKVLMA